MNPLPLWNNTFALTLVLVTLVLAIACIAASRLRLSASLRNSILVPALIITCVIPLGLFAARAASWTIPLPLLQAGSADSTVITSGTDVRDRSRADDRAAPDRAQADRPSAASSTTSRAERSETNLTRPIAFGLLAIWAIGTLVCLVRLGRSYHSLWRLLASAHPVQHPRIAAAAEEAASALGLAEYPTILETDRIGSPVAVGTPRHGWVIWPPSALDTMSHDQLGHVMMHEGAHVLHRDTSLRLLQGLLAAMLWWHPLVHLTNRHLSRTREELCDNAVLSAADPVQYSQTLLEFGRRPEAQPSPALAVALFPEHERLEHRIRNLLDPRRITMDRSRPSVVLTVCLAGFIASALAGATRVTAAQFQPPAAAEGMWLDQSNRELAREYALSFEDKSRHGLLDIDIKRGDILVSAYNGEKVLVRLYVPKSQKPAVDEASGFRDVTPQPLDFEVRQNGNTIELDGNSYEQITHIEVLVPRRIDLILDSYRTGVIRVTGTEGHVRARSQNNDINLMQITGSADVFGYNGDFKASFRSVTGDIEFETYNGDIDLTLPAGIKATTFMRVESQSVRSQFEIVERPDQVVTKENEDGTTSIEPSKYVVGDIDGGGSRVVIETTNGAVVLRKASPRRL